MTTTTIWSGPAVVKVGGSLFDLADLGPRLRRWLECSAFRPILLVPGGGPSADVVRAWDRVHGLGDETAHWLALAALALNARFLSALLSGTRIVSGGAGLGDDEVAILDAHEFARTDEGRPGCLPHFWEVTSDSIAARCAVVWSCRRLVLLKSVSLADGMTCEEAAARGIVDRHFTRVLAAQSIDVRVLCFRDDAYGAKDGAESGG